ncbi:hypothetical protein DYBT9275_01725 [Dyadobacter sp. CECT 9275]|uniref:Carboxypeptidase-like regulatory domain-containing protein n=1 Tax=Dyadobacter helix TaxID=2822344 RepID=A0A916NKR4_9BACT|nr:DUF5686 and carboxypeptidase-like regulatory domain-containing protein [Dyadobacter sp. CECT 9275]CAG4997248.1 hypothetical protein DYBT9275_01725 [Dyadobacter sp. CECT 9275]
MRPFRSLFLLAFLSIVRIGQAQQHTETFPDQPGLETKWRDKNDTLQKGTGGTTVSGQILDIATGQPVPFASVVLVKSKYGTSSDEQGKFVIKITGEDHQITFSSLGYKPESQMIVPGKQLGMTVYLESSQTQLDEIVIKSGKRHRYKNKDNPAVELIRQVIDHKDRNRMQNADYLQYDQYERIAFSMVELSDRFLTSRAFKKYRFLLDTTQVIDGKKQSALPLYMSEKSYKFYNRANPGKSVSVLQAQKQVNFSSFLDSAGLDIYLNRLYSHVDIYANNIFIMTSQFLSPIADHAPVLYKFFITDTLQTGSGNVVEISFLPRNKGDMLFEGKLLVTLDGNYSIVSADLNVNKDVNLNFIRSLQVHQDFRRDPDSRYYLVKSDVKANFGLTKDKKGGVYGQRTIFFQHYKSGVPMPASFYEGKSQRLAIEPVRAGADYFKYRADTLTVQQQKVYSNIDSLKKMPSFKRFIWFSTLVAGGYGDFGKFQAGPVDALYSYNLVEGSRLRVGGRTTPLLNKSIYLEGYTAYGFKDRQLKYYLSGVYSFNQKAPSQYPNNYFKVSYQYDTDIPGQNFLIDKSQSPLASIRRGTNNLWLYNKIFRLDYLKELENHLSYSLMFKNWNQQPAGGLVYQAAFRPDRPIRQVTATEIGIGLRYAPHERIFQGMMHRRTIAGKYPILSAQANFGMIADAQRPRSYVNLSGSVFKRFYLSQFGFSDITLHGGAVMGQVPFPFLNILPANQTYLYEKNAYNMMNFLEFVADHYAGLNVTHSFEGFFLNKIPAVQRLNLREYLSFKILFGGLRRENNPLYNKDLYQFPLDTNAVPATYAMGKTPYLEAGVGIGNIFKILRVSVVKRFNYLNHPGVAPIGVRFSFTPEF